jgi:fructokinase
LYFGTLAQRTNHGFKQIQKFLDHKPSRARSFYDINLRPGCYSKKVISASLHHTDILKLNLDELEACRHIIGSDQKKSLFVRELIADYALHTVALTKGAAGSELHTAKSIIRSAPTPIEYAVDTVGAGDAYAAMLAVGLLKQWPPQKSLSMASAFASRICAIEGAIPETEEFYAPLRRQIHIGG